MESDVENKTSVDRHAEDDSSCPVVTEVGVASANTSGGSISSSDTESWTLIDEDEVQIDESDEVSLFASESVVKFAKKCTAAAEEVDDQVSGVGNANEEEEPATSPQSDSDIEPASEDPEEGEEEEEVDGPPVTNLGSGLLPTLEEQNQDSIVSDGIPVIESGDDEAAAGDDPPAQTWLWASEDDLTMTLSQQQVKDDDGADATLDDRGSAAIASADSSSSDVLSTLYPMVNELPDEFASIRKPVQPVYNHVPNKKLNVLLTTCVVVACALGIGIGIGHFIGWSEKLELQEQYAEERETKMDELTDSLVTCITGEEGNGGDDQDLEERVIRQLSQENNELKMALAQLKSCSSDDHSTASSATTPIPVMLRQRINELMVANADLEKEVARLRYAHSAMLEAEETRYDLHASRSDLQRARETLNDVNTENQQLKIVIGKTRYGGFGPEQGQAQQEEKLKSDVKADGVNEPHQANTSQDSPKCPRTVVDYVKTEWKRLKASADKVWDKVVPPPRPAANKKADDDQTTTSSWGQKFEAKVDSVLRSIPSKVAPAGKKLVKGANKIVNKLEDSLNKGLAKASHFLETQLGEDPLEWKDKQLNKLEKGLSQLLDEWYFDETFDRGDAKDNEEKKCKAQKDKNNNECSADTECKASPKEEKKPITKDNQWDGKKPKKEHNNKKKWDKNEHHDKKKGKKLEKESEGDDWKKKKSKEVIKESYNATDDVEDDKKWVFARANNREESRNEDRKSDWVFDRASNRKKFHQLTDAEWYEAKLKNKDCDGHGGDDCDDLTEMNPGSQNHGQKRQTKFKHEKKPNKERGDRKKHDHHKNEKKKPKDEGVRMSFRKHQETKEQHHKSQQRYSNDGGGHHYHHYHRHHEFKEKSHKKKSSGDFHAGPKFEEDNSKHRHHKRDPRQLNPKKFGREKSREIRLN